MAGPYLLPEDVSAEHALEVLAFLNAAIRPGDIAEGVEIAGELDVGLRIAERIITRRDALGGFTSLEQLYAVPLVGPERFTEIVTTLSAARPPRGAVASLDANTLDRLERRLAGLEATVAGGASLRLDPIQDSAWLGQELTVLAQLRDADGKPLVDIPVTVVSTWGRLRGRAGLTPVAGASVVVNTDHLGLAKVHLAAGTNEGLSEAEHASLSRALATLGSASASARDQLPALTELARSYRAPGNAALRRAVDVHYRAHGQPGSGDPPSDYLSAWPLIPVTLIAYQTPAPETAQVHPTTTLVNVTLRNWLFAWTWAYRQLLEDESSLLPSLSSVSGDGRSSSGVLSDLFARVGTFLKAQDGLVGQLVGQSFAERSLNSFLHTRLTSVPVAERSAVLTGVSTGTRSLATSSRMLAAFDLSRADTRSRIDQGLSDVDRRSEVAGLQEQLKALESRAVTTAQLDAFQSELNAEVTASTSKQLKAFESRFDGALATKADAGDLSKLDAQVDALQASNSKLDAQVDALQSSNSNLNAQVEALQASNGKLDAQVDALQASNSKLDAQIDALQASSSELGNDIRELQLKDNEFGSEIDDLKSRAVRIDGQLSTIATRTNSLDRQVKDVATRSADFDDQIAKLERQSEILGRDLGSVSERLKTVDRDVETLKRRRR